MSSSPRILLTGHVGGRLLPALLERGERIRCLARRPQAIPHRPVEVAHSMAHLADGDVASSIGNSQWVAGTSADARPSRNLSPTRRGRAHAPDGAHVRRRVPGLATLPSNARSTIRRPRNCASRDTST